MSRRRHSDEPRERFHQRRDPVDQHEMPEMIGPELGLESVGGLAKRRPRDAGVGDDEIEAIVVSNQRVGAGAHAGERGQIELNECEASAVRDGCHSCGRRSGLCKIAHCADHLGSLGRERASRLHAETGRDARHQHALAAQVHAR
jgi:hypothetical protein